VRNVGEMLEEAFRKDIVGGYAEGSEDGLGGAEVVLKMMKMMNGIVV